MSSEELKIILNLSGELPEEFTAQLTEWGLSIVNSLEELSDQQKEAICLVLVNEENFKDVEISPKLIISSPKSMHQFLSNEGKGYLDPKFIQTEVGQTIFKRFIGEDATLSFGATHQDNVDGANSIKFVDPLNIGYYADIITTDAYEQGFDFVSLRNYINHVATYFSYLSKVNVVDFPLEVDYGSSTDAFVIQIHCPVESFSTEYLLDAFADDLEKSSPYKGLLSICSSQADMLDIYLLEKSSRLVITGVWFSNGSELKNEKASVLINNISSFSANSIDLKTDSIKEEVRLDANDLDSLEEVSYPGEEELSNVVGEVKKSENHDEDLLSRIDEDDEPLKGHLVRSRRVVDFIKAKRSQEESPIPLDQLSHEEIDKYLEEYPNQEIIVELTDEDRDLIIKCLQDSGFDEAMGDSISNAIDEENKDDYLNSVLDTLSALTLEEADEIVNIGDPSNLLGEGERVKGWLDSDEDKVVVSGESGELAENEKSRVEGASPSSEDSELIGGDFDELDEATIVSGTQEGDENQLVKGSGEDSESENQLVKGSGEDSESENQLVKGQGGDNESENQLVSGSQDNQSDNFLVSGQKENLDEHEKWEVKRQAVVQKVTETITVFKEEGRDLAELDKEIVAIVSDQLNIKANECESLVKGILENATEPFVEESLGTKKNDVFANLERERLRGDLRKRDDQIMRMKRLLEVMKKQLALKTNFEGIGDYDEDRINEVMDMNELPQPDASPVRQGDDVSAKAVEQMRKTTEKLIENKDNQIKQLEARLTDLQQKQFDANGDESASANIKRLEVETKTLSSQLELANNRIATMSETIERQKKDAIAKQNTELEKLKHKTEIAQTALYKFKDEKALLDKKNRELEIELRRVSGVLEQKETEASKEDKSSSSKEEMLEKDKQIQGLRNESKKFEDQYKAASLKVKQLEQKAKFLNAQVEEFSKGNKKKAKDTNSGADGKANHKLKQLEALNNKLDKTAKKANQDLADKKKEAVKLKSENTTLKNKVQELERKLATAARNKKAA